MNLRIIDCRDAEAVTCSLDDRFLVVSEDQKILANCVTRETAETLVTALRGLIEKRAE